MGFVSYSVDGAVAVVRLDRPPVNALSPQVVTELGETFQETADPSIRAVVVTGQPHFAAGADITEFQATYDRSEEGDEYEIEIGLRDVVATMERLEKPIIAAVFGYALGGGLELAMGADFRYLAEDAQVGQPEIKLGIIPGSGGTQRLPRLVGLARARDIVYSGRFVSAEEALAIGLADRLLPSEKLLDEAMGDAARWAEGPTRALAAAKRAMREGFDLPIDEAIAKEAEAFNSAFWTQDARTGVAAFLAKEEPTFEGR